MSDSESEVLVGKRGHGELAAVGQLAGRKRAAGDSQPADGPSFSEELLRLYYDRLFPYDAMFEWLAYGHDPSKAAENPFIRPDFFMRREFSFTVADDVYIRYLCFRDGEEMRKAIIAKQPHKIDIGAAYSFPPKDHNMVNPAAFRAEARELVFDIDMTDYDDVRFCCDGASICSRCWPLMTIAVQVLDAALRADFGFQHILWVYSGRRGIHGWVADPAARRLPDTLRAVVVDNLTVAPSGGHSPFMSPVHPCLARAFSIMEPFFERHVIQEHGQHLLGLPERWEMVLDMLPTGVRDSVSAKWERDSSPSERWASLKAAVKGNEQVLFSIVFFFTYPRLDANVSKARNHLLKAPFCVHPKTGRVCVPLDPARAEEFDPESVPTLSSMMRELDSFDAREGTVADVDKTSLGPFVRFFRKAFLVPLLRSVQAEFRARAQKSAAAATTDW